MNWTLLQGILCESVSDGAAAHILSSALTAFLRAALGEAEAEAEAEADYC